MAIYRATYTVTATDPKSKKPVAENGNWLVGYKTVGGAWKIAWNVVSDTGAAPTAAISGSGAVLASRSSRLVGVQPLAVSA